MKTPNVLSVWLGALPPTGATAVVCVNGIPIGVPRYVPLTIAPAARFWRS